MEAGWLVHSTGERRCPWRQGEARRRERVSILAASPSDQSGTLLAPFKSWSSWGKLSEEEWMEVEVASYYSHHKETLKIGGTEAGNTGKKITLGFMETLVSQDYYQ